MNLSPEEYQAAQDRSIARAYPSGFLLIQHEKLHRSVVAMELREGERMLREAGLPVPLPPRPVVYAQLGSINARRGDAR